MEFMRGKGEGVINSLYSLYFIMFYNNELPTMIFLIKQIYFIVTWTSLLFFCTLVVMKGKGYLNLL